MSSKLEKWLQRAKELGAEQGAACRIECLTVADDITPSADNVPSWLSGEWSDDPTPSSLWHRVTGKDILTEYDSESLWFEFDEIANAYELAADSAYLGNDIATYNYHHV